MAQKGCFLRRGGDLYALSRGLRHHHHALCGRGRLLPDLLDGIALGGAVDPARMRPRHALPLRCVWHPLDTTSRHLTNSKSLTPSCCVTRCVCIFRPLTTHSSLLSVSVFVLLLVLLVLVSLWLLFKTPTAKELIAHRWNGPVIRYTPKPLCQLSRQFNC